MRSQGPAEAAPRHEAWTPDLTCTGAFVMSTSTTGAATRAGFLRTTLFPLGNAGREGESRTTESWAVIGTPRPLQ